VVDQEALESDPDAPTAEDCDENGFVSLVKGFWEPQELDEDDFAVYGVSN
jgi:hypothetical protein